MDDKPTRTYSASEVFEIVELFRDSPELSAEKFSGMEYLADILSHFETKTDADIEAEVRAIYHTGSR